MICNAIIGKGYVMPYESKLILELDQDDQRDVHRAIAEFQKRNESWDGALMPEGGGNLAGRIIGEICRGWLESRGMLGVDPEGGA